MLPSLNNQTAQRLSTRSRSVIRLKAYMSNCQLSQITGIIMWIYRVVTMMSNSAKVIILIDISSQIIPMQKTNQTV